MALGSIGDIGGVVPPVTAVGLGKVKEGGLSGGNGEKGEFLNLLFLCCIRPVFLLGL